MKKTYTIQNDKEITVHFLTSEKIERGQYILRRVNNIKKNYKVLRVLKNKIQVQCDINRHSSFLNIFDEKNEQKIYRVISEKDYFKLISR